MTAVFTRPVWQISSGPASRSYADVFLKCGVALIGPGYAGPWTSGSRVEDFEGGYVRAFAGEEADRGVFVLRDGVATIVAIGLVAGPYAHVEVFDDVNGWDLQHSRRVRWCQLAQPHVFERYAFGARPSRFSRVWNQDVIDFVSRLLNSPPTSWQTAPLPSLPEAEPPLTDVPELLIPLIAQAKDLQPLYWNEIEFGERPSEDEMIVHFVAPFLRALGWAPEQIAVQWRYVDVAVFQNLPRVPENCRLVIEAKRFGEGIEGAREQAKGYVKTHGLQCDVIVTDGIRFRRYRADRDFVEGGYANLVNLKRSASELFSIMARR